MLDTFKLIAPEFVVRGDTEMQGYIDLAARRVTNSSLTVTQKEDLIVYLAAHIATIALKNFKASGAISSVTAGRLSVNYNSVIAKDTFDTTSYGAEYKKLLTSYIQYIPAQIWM